MIINSIIADIATAVNEPYARKVVQILFVVLSLINVIKIAVPAIPVFSLKTDDMSSSVKPA